MASSVTYSTGLIQVQDPKKENVVIYAHPEDKITLGLDISSLRKEVVNGDLVIKTLSGGSITIANYSIMFMQNQTPAIVDSLSKEYSFYDFLENASAVSSSDDPTSDVTSRTISTPKSNVQGDNLASGKDFLNSHSDASKLIGMIDVDEQHPILSEDVSLNPFLTLRLYPEGKLKNDAVITYRYNGRTILNQEEDSTLPVVTRTANPKSNPIYGTKEIFSNPTDGVEQFQVVNTIAGGGDIKGNDYSVYQYSAQTLDYSSVGGSVLYNAYTGNQIVRGLNLYLTDGNSSLSSILIQNVPDGVVFQNTEAVEVQPLGNGTYFLLPKAQSPSVDLYFAYNEAHAVDAFGNSIGLKDILQQIKVSIEGYNAKYQQLVLGDTDISLDFKEVRGDSDLSNFSMFNTYTYSTLFDPLIVSLTVYDDYVNGGVVNHTYNTKEGNDTFISGTGSERVFLGEGDDLYRYNWGSDIVDAKANIDNANNPQKVGIDRLRFDHEQYVDPITGVYSFNEKISISFNNGSINVTNTAINPSGEVDNSVSSFKNFDEIYLEDETGISANNNNTITINSTQGFNGLKIYSGGSTGTTGDTLKLGSASLISFDDMQGAFISTVSSRSNASVADFDSNQKIYFAIYESGGAKDIFSTIQGSTGSDYFLTSDLKNFNVNFNGNGGSDTLDFSLLSSSVTYDANSGEASYGSSNDILKIATGVVIGTDFDDTMLGSGTGSIDYYGHATTSSAADTNIVSYEKWNGVSGNGGQGVEINYVAGIQDGRIDVNKYGRGTDHLYNISQVTASQADDIFYLAYQDSYTLDGLAGNDTVNYNTDDMAINLTININNVTADGADGDVVKGANSDIFTNINGVVGSKTDDVFYIKGDQASGMSYTGGGGNDVINYSGVNDGITISYNLTQGTLTKNTTSGNFQDSVVGFSSLIATSGDDEFIAEDDTWTSNANSLYDGGGSEYDPSATITENNGKLVNGGDVLFLNYDSSLISLSAIESKFKNFDTLRLGGSNNTVSYSETTFKAIWGSTDSTNIFDASGAAGSVDFNISGNVASVSTLSIKLYNFDTLKGSDSGSHFYINNSGSTIVSNYNFVGGQSLLDVLDYTGTAENLTFNLGSQSANDSGTVQKGTTSNQDTFSGIEKFIGGEGDDTFQLNPLNTTYQIDGGAGIDTVSFVNYSAPVTSANIDSTLFTNIERYELTNFADNWLILANLDGAVNIAGGGDLDTISIDSAISQVTYTVGANSIALEAVGTQTLTHTLTSFEILYGTDAASHSTAIDNVIMSADASSNTGISTDGNLYFILNNAKVDYSAITNIGLTLNFFAQKDVAPVDGVTATMSVNKEAGSVDYYLGATNIILTDQDDTIKLDLTAPESFNGVTIDAKGGTNTLDVSGTSFNVVYDSTGGSPTLNGYNFSVENWTVLRTGDGDDTFKISTNESGLTIYAAFGTDTLDLSTFTDALTYDFTENVGAISVGTIVTANDIEAINSGSGDDVFNGVAAGNYTLNGGDGNDSLSYEGASDEAGFIFNLSSNDNSYVVKGSSGNTDNISFIEEVTGTTKDDTFTLDSLSTVTRIDGGSNGRDELFLSLDNVTSGFNFDLNNQTLSGGGLASSIGFANFDVLHGSTFDDTFTLSDDSILTNRGEIVGGGKGSSGDTLNAIITDAGGNNVGLYIDLANGFFYRNGDGTNGADANKPVSSDYIIVQDINNINLGDGNDLILFSGALTAGNYNIDLGGGTNFLSFEQLTYSLSGTLSEIIQSVTQGASFNITGSYGIKLTQFADSLEVTQGQDSLVVDGAGGIDTIDYSGVIDDMTLDFSSQAKAGDSTITITRGTFTDTVSNFEKLILSSGNNTVLAGGDNSVNIDMGSGGGNNILSYENVNGGVIANLGKGTIYKIDSKLLDKITNFTIFKDSLGNDIVYAAASVKEIWGNAGNDTLSFANINSNGEVISSFAYNYKISNASNASWSDGTNNNTININSTAGDGSNSYNRINFGNYKVTLQVGAIDGKSYYAGVNQNSSVSYATVSGQGIFLDFIHNTVNYNNNGVPDTTTTDNILNFTEFQGTNNGDQFTGLNASSNIVLNLGTGDDVVSFTGSNAAMTATIDATGQLATGNVQINKGTTGNLTIGATRFNDYFTITDIAVLDVNRGISGEGGVNTIDFSPANVPNFTIGDAYNYKMYNFSVYIFTDAANIIDWSYDPTATGNAKYLPQSIDFKGGNDTFLLKTDAITGSDISFTFKNGDANNLLSIQNKTQGYATALTLANLEKLIVAGDDQNSFKAVFDGYTYTFDTLFGDQIDFSGVTFTSGISFEYKNYTLDSFSASRVIKDVTNISFLNSSSGRLLAWIGLGVNQNKNLTIKSSDAVDFKLNSGANVVTSNSLVLTESGLTAGFDGSSYTQTYITNKMADSTLNIDKVATSFAINATRVIPIFKTIFLDNSNFSTAATFSPVDFSGYKGQHGNVATGTDWSLFKDSTSNQVTVTGRLANDFSILVGAVGSSGDSFSIILSATNDVLNVDLSEESIFANNIAFDGSTGVNTLVVSKEGGQKVFNIESTGIYTHGSDDPGVNGGQSGAAGSGSSNHLLSLANFSVIDMSAIVRGEGNSTLLNILLDDSSTFTKIIAPNAAEKVAGTASQTPRNTLNGAGYSSDGTVGGVQGGFSTGGNFVVSFDYVSGSTTTMNRLMNVQAQYDSKLFNVQNVQAIYGKAGQTDRVVFSPLTTDQFANIVSQYNDDYTFERNSNSANVENRNHYLYLDLSFTRNEIANTSNNNYGNGSTPEDIIDFSAWKIFDTNNTYADFMMRASRGDSNNNALHMFTAGLFPEDFYTSGSKSQFETDIDPLLVINSKGNNHFILPQTRFYWGGAAYTILKTYTLEFPSISSKDYYAIFDNNGGSYGVSNFSMFEGSSGRTVVDSNPDNPITLFNFTTFYLDNLGGATNGVGQDNTEVIGKNYATEGLYMSNKVFIYFDQKSPGEVFALNSERTNNADHWNTPTNGAKDKVDFSNITNGNYYFSWASWQTQEAEARDPNYVGFQDIGDSMVNGRQATADYIKYINDENTGTGIVFTSLAQKDKVGYTDGYSSNLFYRMQGVNYMTLTGGNDTFALGQVFWTTCDPDSNEGDPVGAFTHYEGNWRDIQDSTNSGKTYLQQVDAGNGVNTFLDNSLSGDIKKEDGSVQTGKYRAEQGLTVGGASDGGIYQYLGIDHRTGEGAIGVGSANKPGEGHMERVYILDDRGETSHLEIRAIGTISSDWGDAYIGSDSATASAIGTKPRFNDDNNGYTLNLGAQSYSNFDKVKIDDFSVDANGIIATRNGYNLGIRDLIVGAAKQNSDYREFNNGGRYMYDEAAGVVAKELDMHVSKGSQIRVQWTNDFNPNVDSSLIIQDGWDGSKYTSYYAYKNWDYLDLGNADGTNTTMTINFVFNTDFDFNKMDGKDFVLDPNLAPSNSSNVFNYFFQADKYNYSVAESGSGNSRTYTITSDDDPSKSFTFKTYFDSAQHHFYENASDAQIQNFNLTPEQISNLETYGNIEGIDNTQNQGSGSGSTDTTVDSFSSYGSSTLNNQKEEEYTKNANFSDGNSGISGFGRGHRSDEAAAPSKDAPSQDDKSSSTNSNSEDNFSNSASNNQEDSSSQHSSSENNQDTSNVNNNNNNNNESNENESKGNGLENISDNNYNHDILNNIHGKDSFDNLFNHASAINDSDNAKVDFAGFTNSESNLDLSQLFNSSHELLSNNTGLSDSLHEMINTVSSIQEEAVTTTDQQDELDSMSFALDSMFNVDENHNGTETGTDHNNKHKNSNNFSN